ncbi:hypothetical protein K443DRAFT_9112 [Laccaria amethystina LaAM-08-1]|uniref:Uncharacterized protein n=1 Tax=Laccaria amethystina LaAM-08-1 TaxID=1095629 RepID=A0A0C9X081_9AGAR|nr:hypothetical protein K443DRAFT_9112 [Laccaria amethystina LaAM-08-1]
MTLSSADLSSANLGITVRATISHRVRERHGSFSDGIGSNRPSIAVLAQELFDSTRSFLSSLKRKGHALVFAHKFTRGWPETYSSSFLPEEII